MAESAAMSERAPNAEPFDFKPNLSCVLGLKSVIVSDPLLSGVMNANTSPSESLPPVSRSFPPPPIRTVASICPATRGRPKCDQPIGKRSGRVRHNTEDHLLAHFRRTRTPHQ